MLCKHLETEGEWLPEDAEMAKQVTAWAPHMIMHRGILCRVKARQGTRTRNRESSNNRGLEPVMQMYIPHDSTMTGDIIKAIHQELGHPGITRTYQAVQDRFFWKGMFGQTYKHVTHCTTCQYHAPKARRAPIAGHVTAARPAEMLTMDIVHMPEVNGYKYLLTVVDVFSKYGAAVPLTEITATAVLTALVQEVLSHGYGRPKYWVVDGGSEFQDVLQEAVELKHGEQYCTVHQPTTHSLTG